VRDTLYNDAAYYRMLFASRQHDLPLYLELAAEAGGELLELGIGAGRVALPLARAGFSVTGIDVAPDMLASLAELAAREPAAVQARLSWLLGDARTAELGRKFRLVICPFNGLAHHHGLGELAPLFATVARHLAPGGLFAFDVLVPDPVLLRGGSSSVAWMRHPRTGEVCRCDEDVSYDQAKELLTIRTTLRFMEAEREPEVLTLVIQQFYPGQTEKLIAELGFELVATRPELTDAVGYVCRVAG